VAPAVKDDGWDFNRFNTVFDKAHIIANNLLHGIAVGVGLNEGSIQAKT
jgi:hypothetical protein